MSVTFPVTDCVCSCGGCCAGGCCPGGCCPGCCLGGFCRLCSIPGVPASSKPPNDALIRILRIMKLFLSRVDLPGRPSPAPLFPSLLGSLLYPVTPVSTHYLGFVAIRLCCEPCFFPGTFFSLSVILSQNSLHRNSCGYTLLSTAHSSTLAKQNARARHPKARHAR